ncbi:M15 family metallopeptidase [Flavobacterium sp.]|uniref:M15 family metallopeptidase n=1 Tax=Flavobacterium sp. TaxID=239 RepID=UPI00286A2A45|nr:M15 family metallopeptidase [Flavobacterium sp.]
MNFKLFISIPITSFLFVSCVAQQSLAPKETKAINIETRINENKIAEANVSSIAKEISFIKKDEIVNDSTFVNLKDYSSDFVYNMKYATADNFLKTKVYDCEACYLRYKTVKALIKANEKFMKKGYKMMLFDCYRPLDIQKKMWQIVSNPNYVADPKKGSIHNRGGAVDISLVDSNGKELDMGTPFDFFGIEASHDYENLSDEVKENRRTLRKIMTRSGFKIFESEWWHYNLKNAKKENISNFKWKCD